MTGNNDRRAPSDERWVHHAGPYLCALALVLTSFVATPAWWSVHLLLVLPLLPLMPATFCIPLTALAAATALVAVLAAPAYGAYIFLYVFSGASAVLLVAHLAGGRGPHLRGGRVERYARSLRGLYSLGAALLFAALFLRDIPLPVSAAWLVFALAARRALPAPPPVPWRRRVAPGIGISIMTVFGLGLTLATLEGGSRVLFAFSDHYPRIFKLDSEYFKRLRPGASTTYYIAADEDVWKPVTVNISRQGFRDRPFGPKAPDEIRIVMLGDSFVFGYATDAGETIPKHLERILNERVPDRSFSVVNAGLSGTGVWQHHGFLLDKGFGLDPDIVMHGLFPFNDITDGLLRDLDDDIEFHTYWFPHRLVSIRNRARWPVHLHEWLRSRSLAYDVIRNRLLDDTGFLPLVNRVRLVKPLAFGPYNTDLGRDPLMEVNLDPWPRDVERGFEMLQRDLLALHEDCLDRGVPFVVYTIPHFLDLQSADDEAFARAWALGRDIIWNQYAYLDDEDFNRVWGDTDTGARYERAKAFNRTVAFLATTDIPAIDIKTPLERHPHPASLYYLLDRHFNEDGHRFVAEVLADALLTEYAHLLPAR